MNNPKELDSETGHLPGIGERVDLSRFMNGTTIKDLMLIGIDDFIHISEYLIQSTYG